VDQFKDVVVGVPTLNGPERLERCLKSVAKYTPLDDLQAAVIVCDDGSSPENLERNRKISSDHGALFLPNEKRLGVPFSWNRLSRHGIHELGAKRIVLINDDVEVVPDWLEALVFSVRENPHAGMVGLNAWQGVNSENFAPPHAVDYNEATMLHGYGMLSSCGYCFAFSAEKYLAVGGFDIRYFCFYEEVSFGLTLLGMGWPSYMLAYPTVIHQGGATTSVADNVDANQRLLESRAIFREKWGSVEAQRALISKKRWPECVSWNTHLNRLKG
jgi:GT2 family glycosyltransferase